MSAHLWVLSTAARQVRKLARQDSFTRTLFHGCVWSPAPTMGAAPSLHQHVPRLRVPYARKRYEVAPVDGQHSSAAAPAAAAPAAAAPARQPASLPPVKRPDNDDDDDDVSVHTKLKKQQTECEALRAALQHERAARAMLKEELSRSERAASGEANGGASPGELSPLTNFKRRNLTQMPLREAVPLAASYLERLMRHRAVHEDEVDVMRRVCDLLQSSRVASALLQPAAPAGLAAAGAVAGGGVASGGVGGAHVSGAIAASAAQEVHVAAKLVDLKNTTMGDVEMKNYILSQFVSEEVRVRACGGMSGGSVATPPRTSTCSAHLPLSSQLTPPPLYPLPPSSRDPPGTRHAASPSPTQNTNTYVVLFVRVDTGDRQVARLSLDETIPEGVAPRDRLQPAAARQHAGRRRKDGLVRVGRVIGTTAAPRHVARAGPPVAAAVHGGHPGAPPSNGAERRGARARARCQGGHGCQRVGRRCARALPRSRGADELRRVARAQEARRLVRPRRLRRQDHVAAT